MTVALLRRQIEKTEAACAGTAVCRLYWHGFFGVCSAEEEKLPLGLT